MIRWPIKLLKPATMRWRTRHRAASQSGANGLTRMAVLSGGGAWACDMTLAVRTAAKVRTAQALGDLMDGGARPILLPVYDIGFAPYPGGPLTAPETVPNSDGTFFSDGTGYESAGISVVLAADAALRATTIRVQVLVGADLMGAEMFSFSHPAKGSRVYRVDGVDALGGGLYDLTVTPPWREAAPAVLFGAPQELDFASPTVVMRMLNAEDFMAAIQAPVKADLTLSFEEAFPDAQGNY